MHAVSKIRRRTRIESQRFVALWNGPGVQDGLQVKNVRVSSSSNQSLFESCGESEGPCGEKALSSWRLSLYEYGPATMSMELLSKSEVRALCPLIGNATVRP